MRVIGGKLRGKNLEWVSNGTTRPTTDRVKENIFNVLMSSGLDFVGARVLCLFSGSGQIGIEAFSRGATDITMNDPDPDAQKIIKRNCTACKLSPRLFALDYMELLQKLRGEKFDFVYLDPPFKNTDAPVFSANCLLTHEMLNPNAIIVAETETPDLAFNPAFNVRQKKYGRAIIYFLTR
jgi:16S rRNA (guanine(966)-N(2))-methyltransferase RsmD